MRAVEDPETGMAAMSQRFHEQGAKLYVPAVDD